MGPLDATINFAKAAVSTGYAAGVTSITLAAGGGARFPTPDFNAVWWNATDFADPADDPTVEIVRVTNISGDVLTIVRGQEGTADVNHNTAGKTYKLIEGITSSQMDIISEAFAVTPINLVWASPASGSAGPPSFRALVAADIGAAGNDGDVQFNAGGVLGASAGLFNWDETDKLLQLGGVPITPYPGLYVGPDENTLPAFMQSYTSATGALFTKNTTGAVNVGIETYGDLGLYLVTSGIGNPFGIESDLYGGRDGDRLVNLNLYQDANSFNLASFSAILISRLVDSGGGGSVIDNIGLEIDDQTIGVNNWSITTALGLVRHGTEATLAPYIQGWSGYKVEIASDGSDVASPGAGLSVLWQGGGNGAISAVSYGGGTISSAALNADAIAIDDGDSVAVLNIATGVDGGAAAASASAIFIHDSFLSPDGSSLVDNYAIQVQDLVNGTNNYILKSGAGMMEVGDATKASGLHIQGAGAFNDPGFGFTQLWLDADSGFYSQILTNRQGGNAQYTGFFVGGDGSFGIDVNSGSSIGLEANATTLQWAFLGSVQSSSWISTLQNTAPADASIAANESTWWFDSTNGAAFEMWKGKTANGTVVTGGLGLNTVAAPSTSTIVLPTSVFGGSAQLLGGPSSWGTVKIGGTQYKVPLYT